MSTDQPPARPPGDDEAARSGESPSAIVEAERAPDEAAGVPSRATAAPGDTDQPATPSAESLSAIVEAERAPDEAADSSARTAAADEPAPENAGPPPVADTSRAKPPRRRAARKPAATPAEAEAPADQGVPGAAAAQPATDDTVAAPTRRRAARKPAATPADAEAAATADRAKAATDETAPTLAAGKTARKTTAGQTAKAGDKAVESGDAATAGTVTTTAGTTTPSPRRWRDESNPDELDPPPGYAPRRGRDPEALPPPVVDPKPIERPRPAARDIEVSAVTTEPWSRPDTVAKLRAATPNTTVAATPATPAAAGSASDDPWSTFVATKEPPPTRAQHHLARAGRILRHEWTVASLLALLAAVVMTWPTLRYPLYTVPQDIWDPTLVAWMLAWSGHILLADPTHLWQGNAFYPEAWSYAYTDSLLGYAPFGMIGTGPEAAILRYNIVFVLAHALAALGAYALVRQLGANRTGAAVAAAAYAYAPWLLAQGGHLHVLSNGGIPLALAMLARGHGWSLRHGYRPERRHAGWALAGWLVAAWQLSLGFGIGLAFAYALALLVVVVVAAAAIRRVWIGRKLFLTDVAGGLVFAAVGGLLAIPYFRVAEMFPNARRTLAEVQFYSPPFESFFTAPPESRIWGESHAEVRAALDWAPEMTLLPGFIVIGLATAGLFFSIWTVRQRVLLLGLVLGSAALAMGTNFAYDGRYTYVPLFENLPGWDGLRTPGRLVLWTTLFLGILAAGAVCAFVDRVKEIAAGRVPPWPGPWLRIATLVPLALVLAEGTNVTPHPTAPVQPVAMRTVDGPLLVLPSNGGYDQHVMLWSTTKFQDVVNGGSGFTPPRLDEVRQVTATFPDPTSISYLRNMGVKNVIILRDRVHGTPLQTAIDLPVDGLGIQREDLGDAVVYRL